MAAETALDLAIDLLAGSNRAAAFTGAGISTPSGIPDFRSPDSGLWQDVDPYEVASVYGFRQRPELFFEWIRPVAQLAFDAVPNDAHLALSQMEKNGPLRGVITQNIDMLHQKAGSKAIYELHGHWREATCIRCYTVHSADTYLDDFLEIGAVPRCQSCEGVLKPNVILMGEQLPIGILKEAENLARSCDLMVIAGSSLKVTPASELPLLALDNGAKLVIINLEPTYLDGYADVLFHDDVVDVLPYLADNLERS